MRQQLFILLYLLGAIQTNVWAKSFELEYSWNCPQPANKYSECAQWAYRNKKNTNNCQGKPAYCDSDKQFLGAF
jgi:hypothetical protein